MKKFSKKICMNQLGLNKDEAKVIMDYYDDNDCFIEIKNNEITLFEYTNKNIQSVYVIKDNFNRIKIGVSHNPNIRVNDFNVAGLTCEVLYSTKKCKNATKIEASCHKYFAEKNIKSEWFNISEKEAIEHLKTYKLELEDDICVLETFKDVNALFMNSFLSDYSIYPYNKEDYEFWTNKKYTNNELKDILLKSIEDGTDDISWYDENVAMIINLLFDYRGLESIDFNGWKITNKYNKYWDSYIVTFDLDVEEALSDPLRKLSYELIQMFTIGAN